MSIRIAVALGFDEPSPGLMARAPRPVGAPVLSAANWVRLCVQGLVMTAGGLVAYQIGETQYSVAVASTMLLTTLSLFHLVAGLMARDQRNTIFDRDAIPGPTQLRRYAPALLAIVAATALGFLQRILDTVGLRFAQWSIYRARGEPRAGRGLIKVVIRRRDRRGPVVKID